MRLFALIVGLVAVAATQAATDLATICAKASDAPKSEDGKDVYTHLCQLHLELLEVEEALQQVVGEHDPVAEEDAMLPDELESHAADKRKNEFIRFGKRKNEFIRFGKRKNEFIRFGKRKNEFIRFGKRKNEFIRFGKRAPKDEYIRFGRPSSDQEPMEDNQMTKRKNEFIRFG